MKHHTASESEQLTEIKRYFTKMAHFYQSEPHLGVPDQTVMSNVSILIPIPGKRYCHFSCNYLPLQHHKNKTIFRIFFSL